MRISLYEVHAAIFTLLKIDLVSKRYYVTARHRGQS